MHHLLLPLYLISLDILSGIASAIIAVFLRFDFKLPTRYLEPVISQLPIFLLLLVVFAYTFRLYNRVWRYASIKEMVDIILACCLTSAVWFGISLAMGSMLPRSLYIMSAILLSIFIGGSRLALRVYSNMASRSGAALNDSMDPHNVLIIGAGDAGAMIAREIATYHHDGRKLIGFVDDDPAKKGLKMYGTKVLGDRTEIQNIVEQNEVGEIIIAMPSVRGDAVKEIVDICNETRCQVKILPGIYEIINGQATVAQLRNVDIADLLGREQIKLDNTAVESFLKDRIVLVTGAGGSIGSEICRQVARMNPKKLLLLGKGENSIYEIHQELKNTFGHIRTVPIIADVRDRERIAAIMDYFHPEVVFHAAAHKHVPLMEYQPIEAAKNNVLGTKTVAEEADAHGVEAFVLISTDKAVNPTSVMGCTKRVAEMFVQSMSAHSKTRFVAVRFGNVLGSRGSVIPLFKKQIAAGGPVTVTHPDMKRYFMTIPEASQLVLQAGAMAKGGEVFVLDMGEPVKICDLAKNLIILSGLVPEKDIKIQYTGLRPGEKLFEELLSAEDGTESTENKKIFRARIKQINKAELEKQICELLKLNNEDDVVEKLKQIVPTYHPNRIKD